MPGTAIEPVVCGFDKHEELRGLLARSRYTIYASIPYSKQSIGRSERIRRDMCDFESMLKLISRSGIEKACFVSVSGTIGRIAGSVGDETCVQGVDARRGWGHLRQKLAAENMIAGHVKDGLAAVIVNPSMCVGEFDTKPSTGEFFRFFTRFPFALMPDELLNIVAVDDVAIGTILALEKGRVGDRYILSSTNTTMGAFIGRIKQIEGKSMPRLAISRKTAVVAAYMSEVLNLILRWPAPIIPLLGIEIIEQGSQHLTSEKAERELGFAPRDAWSAVDRAYQWYKQNGIL
jgi:dihydroflavonol-4-reductase